METATRMNGSPRPWYKENLHLMEGLSELDSRRIAERSAMKVKAKGSIIFAPGEPCDSIYFLQRGRIKVGSYSTDGRETIKAIIQAGHMFGEKVLFGQTLHSDFAVALDSDVCVLALPVKDALGMMKDSPEFGIKIMATIASHSANMERRLEALTFKDARTRIIDLIREMAQESGQQLAGGSILVNHSLTHQDIACLTATSRQTVTTVLNDLKEMQIINFDRKSLLIHDLSRL